jgi:hypothetical protein
MISIYKTVLSALFLMAMAHPVSAETWRVEKDGSADFTVIQEALDVSSPGDTVLIGPGRFTETTTVVVPGWTEDTYAVVWTDSVTIIGSGADVTIIGPESQEKQPSYDRPKGLLGLYAEGCRVSNLSVENIRDGVYWEGGLEIAECTIRECVDALISHPSGGLSVSDVLFEQNSSHAILAWGPCPDMRVMNCEFADSESGISVVGLGYLLVADCTFTNHVVSVQYDSTIGEIRSCNFFNSTNVDVVSIGSHLTLTNCRLSPAYRSISASTWGWLRGSGNVIPAGEGERIRICNTLFYFNGNNISRTDSPYIRLDCFMSLPHDILDFTGNYWGTTNADSISANIIDGNDEPEIHAFVDFLPFSDVPVSNTKKSWGDLKSMFR